jgi:hypothetical protein
MARKKIGNVEITTKVMSHPCTKEIMKVHTKELAIWMAMPSFSPIAP